jgi:hypothetical protein
MTASGVSWVGSSISCLNFLFSSRSCRSRRISAVPMLPYLAFHRKKVAWLTPSLRQMSSTGGPASACRRAGAIYSSVNVDFRARIRSS